MAHWKTLANYNYLGSYSLDGVDEVTLTIKKVAQQAVTAPGGTTDMCIVCDFVESGTVVDGVEVKPMILNATNCKTIEAIYETGDVNEWEGKRVTIFKGKAKFAGQETLALRIKREIPPTVEEKHYHCEVCGKEINEKTYNASVNKYGKALCSKECLEKAGV